MKGDRSLKNFTVTIFLLALFLPVPVVSGSDQCHKLLDKVACHPKERLAELVEKAPESCKLAIKEKIFKVRRVIVDDFFRQGKGDKL